jgi:hypothetical protein
MATEEFYFEALFFFGEYLLHVSTFATTRVFTVGNALLVCIAFSSVWHVATLHAYAYALKA